MSIEKRFLSTVQRLSLFWGVAAVHRTYRDLVSRNFTPGRTPWFTAHELAMVAKFVYLEGSYGPYCTSTLGDALNIAKSMWRAGEEEREYNEQADYAATFLLRFIHQQVPFVLMWPQLQANLDRMRAFLKLSPEFAQMVSDEVGCSGEVFLAIADTLARLFLTRISFPKSALEPALIHRFGDTPIRSTLEFLTCTRQQLTDYRAVNIRTYKGSLSYEFNELLRYPVLNYADEYWCAIPELLNYASTRGIYFSLSDKKGHAFREVFAKTFEAYVTYIAAKQFGKEKVITEEDERIYGWSGKTNDVTLLINNGLLLLECKNSGLFSISKKSADLSHVRADIRKNLANARERCGLFQLNDKVAAISAGKLPTQLNLLYANRPNIYPVLLLFDELWMANRPEVLRSLIDEELRENGTEAFDYQIWHIAEFEALLETVPAESLETAVREKSLDPEFRYLDLATYLATKWNRTVHRAALYVPSGESKAWKVLERLQD